MGLSRCYRMKGQYEEALAEIKKSTQVAPDWWGNYLMMAVNYAFMDRQEEAAASAKKVLELNPNFSIERMSKAMPYKNPAEIKIVIDAMRSGKPAGTTVWIDPLRPSSAAESTISSTHGFGVAQAIELLRSMKKLPRRIRILGIEGQYYALGAPISPPVQEAVKTAVGLVLLAVKPKRRK